MDLAPKILLASANDNIRSPARRDRLNPIPREFVALTGKVLNGRDAYRRAGLSLRGTRTLQALGYLAPDDLPRPGWAWRPGERRQLERAKAVRGCGPHTIRTLRCWLSEGW